MDHAKVFMTGRSQAVRLPMAYRFAGREVAIRREGEVVILEPLKASRWPPGLLKRAIAAPPSALPPGDSVERLFGGIPASVLME